MSNFQIGFDMAIGHLEQNVTVCAVTNGYELEAIHEVYTDDGVDIAPYLGFDTLKQIYSHYERHADAINKASMEANSEY